ncbi:hypothetical protein RJT34_19024 [Clitoria ternatea]|uniref:Uncharacterized protein n=1 Tax=Clitoria ternatea TaxID=43366 RepID=A0AAN9IQA1_CLITE
MIFRINQFDPKRFETLAPALGNHSDTAALRCSSNSQKASQVRKLSLASSVRQFCPRLVRCRKMWNKVMNYPTELCLMSLVLVATCKKSFSGLHYPS